MADRNYNTGNYNTGYDNTGSFNTGHYNTGHYNTGYDNTGSFNTGHYNTGNYNTGNCNTGYSNTGNYNTGNCHTGCFNTLDAEKAYYFNKLIDRSEWNSAEKPNFFSMVMLSTWIPKYDMTGVEKDNNPSYETTGGYLKVRDYKEAWGEAFKFATEEDIKVLKALPGFDPYVFFEITGIDLRESDDAPCEGRQIEVDGVTYVLKKV